MSICNYHQRNRQLLAMVNKNADEEFRIMQLPTHYEYLQYLRITIDTFGNDLPYDLVMELIREEAELESESIIL